MSSIPARRVCTTIQRRAARSAPKLRRFASSHAHDDHHEQPHPFTYPKETLTTRPFILTGAAFVTLLGLNEAGFFKADETHPIKRYMASKIPSNESLLQENLARIEEVKESAADYRLRTSARKRVFKQVKNPGSMALAGDDGLAVTPRPDVNTINPRRTFNEV
ncbi:hypothetical protein CPB86DRAFT_697461 [Serendipita vermifera]|nr:hypothetical protein CPB86DRAFT_697461 [Serendipita vermifera]